MKHIIEFNLPDDQSGLDIVMAASKNYCMLHDIKDFLRQKSRYENKKSVLIEDIYNLISEFEE